MGLRVVWRVTIHNPLRSRFLLHNPLRRRLPPSAASAPPLRRSLSSIKPRSFSCSAMQGPEHTVAGVEESIVDEYESQAKLLHEFFKLPSIDKAWCCKSGKENVSSAVFSMSQPNLLANKRRKYTLSAHLQRHAADPIEFQWSPFPIEMSGTSAIVPSPSGLKLLVVRNSENDSSTVLEIWDQSHLEKEIQIPQSTHGSIYTDGWFEGIAWNKEENFIAYVAEEQAEQKPTFNDFGFKKDKDSEKDCTSWKGQGDWKEHWGETYSKKRRPTLFVINISSGEVRAAKGIPGELSIGQVVWAPLPSGRSTSYLIFVGWSPDNGLQKTPRKLGIKYCYNRPCALYAVTNPFQKQNTAAVSSDCNKVGISAIKLTDGLSSAYFPRFSPDGRLLVFLSSICAVESGAHSATNSLHKICWPADGDLSEKLVVTDVVLPVMCPQDNCFPGLYCFGMLSDPWLSDGCTMILSSVWRSAEVILSVNVSSSEISRVSPEELGYSWHALALHGDDIIAVSSSPLDPPQVTYGLARTGQTTSSWDWKKIRSPFDAPFDSVRNMLSVHKLSIFDIPVSRTEDTLSDGGKLPFEAIFVSCKESLESPTVVFLHGGPHSVSSSSFYKSWAFLSSLGYNLLIVNYRGSIGFGEEPLQSLPGKVGSQDVNDVLAALDYVINKGLVDASKVAVLGGSHGGFLTAHLVGQAPDRFAVAVARNPVCDLLHMVGVTDIPDWCFVETYGKEGKSRFSEYLSPEHFGNFHNKSPIAHISKVKAPMLILLGAQDLRVPFSIGLQYARALKEVGVETKVIVFPDDIHGLDKPQSDYEGLLNIGVWFKKHLGA